MKLATDAHIGNLTLHHIINEYTDLILEITDDCIIRLKVKFQLLASTGAKMTK